MHILTQEEIESIRNDPDQKGWRAISCDYHLSEEFIREFQDKVSWVGVSVYQTLSEDFIREFQDKVNWPVISSNQKLSEDFIREFQDEVEWFDVSYGQTLSEDFIREFQDRLFVNTPTIRSQMVSYEEIMSYKPCEGGVGRYLSHTSKEGQITWNQLLERHKTKKDINWLFGERWYKLCK